MAGYNGLLDFPRFVDGADAGPRWCPENFKFEFLETVSSIARWLILDCDEVRPGGITSAETNSKFHRFVCYEKAELVARNWEEIVSSGRFLGPSIVLGWQFTAPCPVILQISQLLRVLPIPRTRRIARICTQSRRL